MKKTLIALTLLLTLFNCSSDGDSEETPVQETCGKAASVDSYGLTDTSITFQWNYSISDTSYPDHWELEIGPEGFSSGNGNVYTTVSADYYFNDLSPSTTYDVYIMAICSNGVTGEKVGPYSFTTEGSCGTPSNLSLYYTDDCGFSIDWYSEETAWEIEYGESGFELGTGITANTSTTSYYIHEDIWPNTTYEVYVKSNCGSQGESAYTGPLVVTTDEFYTSTLASNAFVGNYEIEDINATIGPANDTQNFTSGTVNLQVHPTNPNKRYFYTNIFPAFTSGGEITVTLEFNTNNFTIGMENIETTLSCNSGASYLNLANAGSENSVHNLCDEEYFVVTYIEDVDSSCNGPYISSFSLTKL